jgi:translation initiation factor 2 beta subunit (eIF-2beta)/eIF-5
MDTKSLHKFLENMDEGILIDIGFARKNRGVINSPQISYELKYQIVDMMLEYVQKEIKKNKIVDYQAMGVLDGEIERIEVKDVLSEKADEAEQSFIIKISDEKKFDWGKVDYYIVEIENQGKVLKLYRQFQKMKRLRKGLFLQAFDNELVRMDSDFIGIDDNVDILEWEQEFLVFNHIALERIFGYKDLFEKKTKEALKLLKDRDIFANVEEFQEACMRDSRILKRFTNIMQKERLPLFFNNIDKVPKLIKELGLHLEIDQNNQLVYSNRSQLYEITNLMSDAYFRSLLAERIGVAKLEGSLEE